MSIHCLYIDYTLPIHCLYIAYTLLPRSTSNIEKQQSARVLDKKYSSVGASICSLKESLLDPPVAAAAAPKKTTITHSIKRRFSMKERKREGAVPRQPTQSCITACFGLKTGDSADTSWRALSRLCFITRLYNLWLEIYYFWKILESILERIWFILIFCFLKIKSP